MLEKRWSGGEAERLEFPVQRWLSVDDGDGDVVREVATERSAAADRPAGQSLCHSLTRPRASQAHSEASRVL